jgi:His-Xaa-Ser system protein HxsD
LYSKEALLQACYWFTDRAYLVVTATSEQTYEVVITPKPGQGTAASDVAGELANALIDSELRQVVTRETGGIRELVFAKAFAEGGLLADPPPGDDRDPVELRRASSSSSPTLKPSGQDDRGTVT